jgi:hypothetical protein
MLNGSSLLLSVPAAALAGSSEGQLARCALAVPSTPSWAPPALRPGRQSRWPPGRIAPHRQPSLPDSESESRCQWTADSNARGRMTGQVRSRCLRALPRASAGWALSFSGRVCKLSTLHMPSTPTEHSECPSPSWRLPNLILKLDSRDQKQRSEAASGLCVLAVFRGAWSARPWRR